MKSRKPFERPLLRGRKQCSYSSMDGGFLYRAGVAIKSCVHIIGTALEKLAG